MNETVTDNAASLGLCAELILSRMHTLILQDAFGRTAREASVLIEKYKAASAGEEEHEAMLKELALYPKVSFADEPPDTVPLGSGPHVQFRLLIEGWVNSVLILIVEVFAHKDAVRVIEQKYFRNHRILCRDVEAKLEQTIRTVEAAVASFNEYQKVRSEFCGENGDQKNQEDGTTSATPQEREDQLCINIDRILGGRDALAKGAACNWVETAKEEVYRVSLKTISALEASYFQQQRP